MSLATNSAPLLGRLRRDGVECRVGRQMMARGNRWTVRTGGRNVSVASKIDTKDRWWEKEESIENMVEIDSTNQFVEELSTAGNNLVICDFYARWCGACRALYPKLCKLAQENPDIIFLKVEFESNKDLCRTLGVKVLPYFHFYRGAEGRLANFSASLTKFSRLKEAIEVHNTARCPLGPTLGLGDEEELLSSSTK